MKKQFLSFSVTMLLLSSLSFAQIPIKGLVAWYPFSGNANDYTDNNNNGTVNGATLTTDRFGNPNSAYLFDGLSNILVSSSEKLIIRNGTISLWFYTNSQTDQMILAKRNLVNASNQNYSLAYYQNQLDFQTNYNSNCNPTGAVHNYVNGNYSQKWHNLVAVIGTDSIKTYLDGNFKNSIVATLNKADSCNGSPLLIGRTQDNNDWFKGSIDDIRIYNRVLTKNEITALYNENQCLSTISVTDTLKIGKVTGLNTLPDNFGLLKIYPNPANSVLFISVSNPTANYSIQITNQLGQVLYTNTLSNSSLQVNVNSIGANGLYFIKILDLSNNVLDTRKLVLE